MNAEENIVTLRDTVKVKYPDGKIRKFQFIVNHSELDPVNGYISSNSPIGQALLGAAAGEKKKYKVGDREFEVEILEVIKYKSEVESEKIT